MYRDNTLIPTETIRLAALGTLMERDVRYSDLASEIRYFVGRIIGPSLDRLGTSLELLTSEGLIEVIGGEDGEATVYIDDHELSLREFGWLLCTHAGWGKRVRTAAQTVPVTY